MVIGSISENRDFEKSISKEYLYSIKKSYQNFLDNNSDINIINPSFIINPNISDESGYTADFGFRGNFKDFIFYDINSFYLFYSDRIGFVQKTFSDSSVKNEKGNVGESGIDVYASMSDGADGFDQLYVTKEFIEGTEPFEFDVTNIIKQMVLENIPNHGFRISFSELEEQNGKTYFLKSKINISKPGFQI